MTITQRALQDKILEMYPELARSDILLSLRFEQDTDSWLVHLQKDSHGLDTRLRKEDAEDCLGGHKCVSLGINVDRFIDSFTRA